MPSGTRLRSSSLLASGAAYRDSATAKDVEDWKAEHGAGRGYRGEPTTEPDAAVRLRVPDHGRDRSRGPDPRPGQLPQPPAMTIS